MPVHAVSGRYAESGVRRLFVSPHLDDAVFACGEWIASSSSPAVATIFAGSPPAGAPLTAWDAECGFHDGDDPIAARRDEDRAALAVLDARPIWLDFRDDQYGEPRSAHALADALASVIECEHPSAIHFPLGLFHADHRRASETASTLVERFPSHRWYVYEDAIYRRIAGAVDARLRALRAHGLVLEHHAPALARDAAMRKREAVACYRSQLRALGTRDAHDDMHAPEAHWRVLRSRASA